MRSCEPVEQVSIRAVRPDDKERIVKAFRGLDQRSVYLRFFHHKKDLKHEELRRVTECDGVSEVVLLATVGSGDQETIVGLGNYVRSGPAADIAFAVEEDFQGRRPDAPRNRDPWLFQFESSPAGQSNHAISR